MTEQEEASKVLEEFRDLINKTQSEGFRLDIGQRALPMEDQDEFIISVVKHPFPRMAMYVKRTKK